MNDGGGRAVLVGPGAIPPALLGQSRRVNPGAVPPSLIHGGGVDGKVVPLRVPSSKMKSSSNGNTLSGKESGVGKNKLGGNKRPTSNIAVDLDTVIPHDQLRLPGGIDKVNPQGGLIGERVRTPPPGRYFVHDWAERRPSSRSSSDSDVPSDSDRKHDAPGNGKKDKVGVGIQDGGRRDLYPIMHIDGVAHRVINGRYLPLKYKTFPDRGARETPPHISLNDEMALHLGRGSSTTAPNMINHDNPYGLLHGGYLLRTEGTFKHIYGMPDPRQQLQQAHRYYPQPFRSNPILERQYPTESISANFEPDQRMTGQNTRQDSVSVDGLNHMHEGITEEMDHFHNAAQQFHGKEFIR